MSQRFRFPVTGLKRYTSDAPRAGTLELTVDWEKLVRVLATKAAFNRRGTSALGVGIKAKFVPHKAEGAQ